MCKRLLHGLLALALTIGLVAAAPPASAASNAAAPSITWTNAAKGITINGKQVASMPLRNVNGVPYCAVKFFFESVLTSPNVYWANKGSNVSGTTAYGEKLTFFAQPGTQYMQVNGQSIYVPNGIKMYDGYTIAPIEQLAAVFQGSVCSYDWGVNLYQVTTGAYLSTASYQQPAAASTYQQTAANTASYQPAGYYDAQALDLIARIINSEAGSMSLEGKVSVGNVIMNRVYSSEFPNTVYGVIYQPNQFTVVNTARFSANPSEQSIAAAKMVLDGVNYVPGAVFYNVSGLNSWASRNRTYLMSFAGHDFYK